jgi:hypothetical protein
LVGPRGDIRRGFFHVETRDRTAAAHRGLALVETRSLSADQRAAVRTSYWPCTRERAGPQRKLACAVAVPGAGIGFAPETIALSSRSAALFAFMEEPMTAYLISLALAGLVAIVVWEALS